MHKKTNKVVKRIKKRETPSTPKLKFKFKRGTHTNLVTNWNDPTDLLKKIHKNNETIYKKQDAFNAIDFNKEWLDARTNNNKKVLINGKTIKKANKFVTSKKEKSNINTL